MHEKRVIMARVGLLEDNARIAKLCATMLQFAGHSVVVYEHPRTCLNALLQPAPRSDTRPRILTVAPSALPIEILILDLQLPEMTGIEVLQKLQMHPHARMLPLVFCTASSASDIAQALRVAPHASVIEKPFRLDVLVSTVASALNTWLQ